MINPDEITTVRVGELPPAPFELTDNVPHEIGDALFRGTVQQLADVIGDYLGAFSGLAFNPTTVVDGGNLPATSTNEWMLVGKGTFHNVGGGSDIVTTEELNAITSNGTYWTLAVEIPINVELAGITQNIRSGYTETTPSENAVFLALQGKANTGDIVPAAPILSLGFNRLISPQQDFNIPAGKTAIWANVNGTDYFPLDSTNTSEFNTFSQSSNVITFTNILETGELLRIFYQ